MAIRDSWDKDNEDWGAGRTYLNEQDRKRFVSSQFLSLSIFAI